MISNGPFIHTDNLKLWYDCGSYKSFKGEPTKNLLATNLYRGEGVPEVDLTQMSGTMNFTLSLGGGEGLNWKIHEIIAGDLERTDSSGIVNTLSFRNDEDGNEIMRVSRPGSGLAPYTASAFIYPFLYTGTAFTTAQITGHNLSGSDLTFSWEYKDNFTETGRALNVANGIRVDTSGAGATTVSPTYVNTTDNFRRYSHTWTQGSNDPFFACPSILSQTPTEWTFLEFKKPQLEAKSYATNYTTKERLNVSGSLFNLVDTGNGQIEMRNTPFNSGGLHKLENSNANIPLINGYLDFDTNNIMICPYQPKLSTTSEMTIELVFSSNLLTDTHHPLWGRYANYPFLGTINTSPPKLWYVFKHATAQFSNMLSTTEIVAGQIYHAAVTWKHAPGPAAVGKMYVNGNLEYRYEGHIQEGGHTQDWLVLMARTLVYNPKDQKFFMFRYYDKTLSDKQILSNFNSTKARFGL